MTSGLRIEVRPAAPDELAEPFSLLVTFLRDGEPIPPSFVRQLEKAVERGDLEVLVARTKPGAGLVGVAVLAFQPSVSAGALFASIEDLYVSSNARRRGVGRALLEAVKERCKVRGVSYIEVQTDDEAVPFYSALGFEPEPGLQILSSSYLL